MGKGSGRHLGRLGLAGARVSAGAGLATSSAGTAGAAASGSPVTIVMIT